MDRANHTLGDPYLESLKASRKRPAVLKAKLGYLRSNFPSVLVFAFEGKDDKVVYSHWVKRIRQDLKFEPFPCDGKEHVLDLRDLVHRDRGDIGKHIYFFVDRDYDDLRGKSASADLFMTDTYAIENYLVSEAVLEELLKNEYHCHGEIERRTRLLSLFENAYEEFLEVTRDVNFRLFVARRLKIELDAALPDRCNRLATVTIESITKSEIDVKELVKLKREPTAEEFDSLAADFDSLDKAMRYRGKFALLFFMKWLERLKDDRNDANSRFFPPPTDRTKVHFDRIGLDSLASKSDLPTGLAEFVQRIEVPA